ncbi:MAG: hypothetical protein IPN27_03490 [Cellvibrionales bacterium]|nr:hypothetical protein [Cellvibrionales bacterium]
MIFSNNNKAFPWMAFIGCVLFYAALVAIGFDDIEEDAFIYFRFAENIAHGYGYVFNIGGEHIEACSGLLWLGLITLLTFLPLHIVLATKLLCFVFGVLCIQKVFVLSQRFISDRFLSRLPAFLMVASIPFYVWSVRGLETAFYWFVMLWLVDWVTNPQRVHWWWLPAIALINARPEGLFMLGAVVPYLFFCQRVEAKFWQGTALVVLSFVAVTLWRFWYFHDVVPHPFYFKVNPDHLQSFKNLLTYGWHSGWWLLLLVALPGVLQRWDRRDLALAGALVLSLLWTIFVFEDKVFNRHTGIALPFVYIFSLMLLARWWRPRAWLQVATSVLLGALVVFTLTSSRYVHFKDSHPSIFVNNFFRALGNQNDYWQTVGRLLSNPDDFKENPAGMGVFNIRYNFIAAVGDFVHLNYRDNAVVVYDQIGQAPWYAGSQTVFIDNLGLGYRAIGLARFHQAAQQSWVYRHYETVMDSLVRFFWPEEKRAQTDAEIIDGIMAQQPDVIVARKGYISKERNNILTMMLRNPEILAKYQARYLLNNREIIFERVMPLEPTFHKLADGKFLVPAGSTVKAIASFAWCDGSPCMVLKE